MLKIFKNNILINEEHYFPGYNIAHWKQNLSEDCSL